MTNTRPIIFQSSDALIDDLTQKSTLYPLLAKLYIPIIKEYSEKYKPTSDFDDWLLIPYFHHLWYEGEDLSSEYKKYLCDTELDLQMLSKALCKEGFENLCEDLLSSVAPTINGVHNDLLSFYGELKGMLSFAQENYRIERIPKKRHEKTPDFKAIKGEAVVIVECKFIHASRPEMRFIKRYTHFLSYGCKAKVPPLYFFSYDLSPQNLNPDDIQDLKAFVNKAADLSDASTLKRLELSDRYGVNINYKPQDIGPALVTVENQVVYYENELKKFFKDYIFRRSEQALKQLKKYSKEGESQCVYIFIELDEEYHLPYGDMCDIVHRIKEDFEKNHGLDATIRITDSFSRNIKR